MVVLDTNILIDHLRSTAERQTALHKILETHSKASLALSVISVQELYEGKSTKSIEREKDLLLLITPLRILPYTYETAQLAGSIARDLARPIELADAAIAATTILATSELFTLNQKDFINIPDLQLVML